MWAILSGIEGNLVAYEAVLKALQRTPVEQVFILGDCIGPTTQSEALVRKIRQQTNVEVLRGWWEEQALNLHGLGAQPEALTLVKNYDAQTIRRFWETLSPETLDWLRNLNFGVVEQGVLYSFRLISRFLFWATSGRTSIS